MNRFLINRKVHLVFLLGLLFAASYISYSDNDLRKRLQFATFDAFNKWYPRAVPEGRPVIIVDIDEDSLQRIGQWPWPRDVLGDLVLNLKNMGAKVTTFDMVFAEPDRTAPVRIADRLPDTPEYQAVKEQIKTLPDNDEAFAAAIKEAGNVVTAFTAAKREETLREPLLKQKIFGKTEMKEAFLKHCLKIVGAATNLPLFSQSAAGNGSFIAAPEMDGIIRSVSLLFSGRPFINNEIYPSLNLETLRVAETGENGLVLLRELPADQKGDFDLPYLLKVGAYEVPIDSNGKFWVYYREINKKTEYISAYKILDESYHDEVAKAIDGKIVFVGASPEGLKDIRSTPLELFVPGVEVHVNVVEQILQKSFLVRPPLTIAAEFLFIFCGGFLMIVLAQFISVFLLTLLCSFIIAAAFFISWVSYLEYGLLLDPVFPGLAVFIIFLCASLLTYIRSEAERKQVRSAFGLYISPHFMAELTKHPEKLKLGGETRELSVMFTDIRNFTSISEPLEPEELTRLMNKFLTPMSDVVMENRGTIDKYMGDAMMAFWNAPLDDPDHARHACIAALRMEESLAAVNADLRIKAAELGVEPIVLRSGIGINTGPANVGNMGSQARFAYSALGDSVNLASRLEGQTKLYGVDVMISESTAAQVPAMAFLELDLIRVKGKNKPVRVYALLGDEEQASSEAFKAWKEMHDTMLAHYRAANFEAATRQIAECRRLSDGQMDGVYDLYQKRIREFQKTPPGDDWDGVYTATSK